MGYLRTFEFIQWIDLEGKYHCTIAKKIMTQKIEYTKLYPED